MRDKVLGWALHVVGSAWGFWAACGLLWGALVLFVVQAERQEYGAPTGYAAPIFVALAGALVAFAHRTFGGWPRPGADRRSR